MNRNESDMYGDILNNNFAIAISEACGGARPDFIAVNEIFSTFFGDITGPGQLYGFITSHTENKKVIKYNDGYWEILELDLGRNRTVHILKNISYEMIILQRLKDQLKDLAGSRALYSKIVNEDLPIGVLMVDDEYNAVFVNDTLKRLFRIPPKAVFKKCYNYLKEIRPCADCILEGFRGGETRSKKSFDGAGGMLITAEAHPTGDKYVVIFRDTTREIGLIRDIKVKQENLERAHRMIAEQHDILKRLSNINIRIGQLRDLEAILEVVINSIIDTFVCARGAILLFNRAGQIENAHFTSGISGEERDRIIREFGQSGEAPEEKLENYEVVDMVAREQTTGKIFLYRPEKNVDQSVLELFLMQVNIYLENLKLQRRLEEVAHTDSLTGVFNRYYFDKQFKEECTRSERFGQSFALIVVDVNGLKEANDRYGHELGDGLLKETALLLNTGIGAPDSFYSIYRVGGDEFVILLSNCSGERLKSVLEMFETVQRGAVIEFNGEMLPVRFSSGGVCSAEVSHDKLIDTADKRMYENKKEYYKTHKKYR